MNEILFQKNVEKWAETNPKKAYLLPYLGGRQSTQIRQKLDTESLAKKWFSNLDLKNTSVIFVYGVGLGNYYKAAKDWLSSDHQLIFLEDDLEVIYQLFHTEIGEEIIHNKHVSLYYFEDIQEAKNITLALRWEFFMKKIEVTCHDFYEKTKKEKASDLMNRILNDQALHNSLVKEYLDYGVGFFKNFYENLDLLPGSFLGTALFNKFKNVPAIICGAGPSLELHYPLLKKMHNKALIFAGGSSLNALVANGIMPHFGAGIDPNAAQALRIKETCHVKIPFFFRNRIYHNALKMIQGPRLYIPGSGGYDVSEWFEDKLKIDHDLVLDEGHNVINFEVEIAKALGCHPIIFVGMDLGYTGMRLYSKGIVKDSTVTKKELLKSNDNRHPDDFDLKAILKKDILGKPLYTLWKWIVESEWMGEFAKLNPETLLINATEGGLGFPGIKNQSLKSLQKHYLTKNYRLQNRIEKYIKNANMTSVTHKKIKDLRKTLFLSLKRCISNLDVLLEEIHAASEKIKLIKKIEPGFNVLTGRAALFESDLIEEDAYVAILAVFSEAYSGVLNHEMREIRTGKMTEKEKALKKLDLSLRRLAFLKTVAEVNLELMRMTGVTA